MIINLSKPTNKCFVSVIVLDNNKSQSAGKEEIKSKKKKSKTVYGKMKISGAPGFLIPVELECFL